MGVYPDNIFPDHVNILGTEYSIQLKSSVDDISLKNSGGCVDFSTKKIVVGVYEPDCELENFPAYQRKVMRHEIIHAYFNESGMNTDVANPPFGVPETYVDWFALQAPKIFKTFSDVGCMY